MMRSLFVLFFLIATSAYAEEHGPAKEDMAASAKTPANYEECVSGCAARFKHETKKAEFPPYRQWTDEVNAALEEKAIYCVCNDGGIYNTVVGKLGASASLRGGSRKTAFCRIPQYGLDDKMGSTYSCWSFVILTK